MKLVVFQRYLKLKLISIKKINQDISKIDELLYHLSNKLDYLLTNNLIDFNSYYLNMTTLEEIFENYSKLPQKLTLQDILKKKYYISKIRKEINKLITKLKFLTETVGLNNLYNIIDLFLNLSLDSINELNFKKDIEFLNKVCTPIGCKYYTSKINIENKIVIYENINFLEKYDSDNLKKNSISFKVLYNSKKIIEFTRGARIYIPLKKHKMTLAINVIFNNDPISLQAHFFVKTKLTQLKKIINDININTNFKQGYIKQLSLRDIVIYTPDKIGQNCFEAYKYITELKNDTISQLIKKFLTESLENQRNILTYFILLKDDINTNYSAYLLYDLISNESYLLKAQPLSQQLYDSLHWTIQKQFKIVIKKIDEYNANLLTFNESEISYDKRIALLKVDDYVKHKAMEKYKEVMSKGGENSHKSKQYLDGLLNIPFGIFKKEKIFLILTELKTEIKQFVFELDNECKHNNLVINLVEIYKKKKLEDLKGKDIDDFFCELEKIKFNHFFKYFKNIDIIINQIKSYKQPELKTLVKKFNDDLNINLVFKTTKKNLQDNLISFIKSIDKTNIKHIEKTVQLLQLSNETTNYNCCKKLIKTQKKWNNYKNESCKYLNNVQSILDKAVFAQEEAKNEVLRIIAQWINGQMKGYCIGFEGPPGTGKTSLAKKGIANCLKDIDGNSRPFAFIPIGGSSNGSVLEGHSYTYVGSTWGKIVDVLMETKCMNPIIYIDELDKISRTESGREIIGILTHLTDSSQNDEFFDKYFSGIKIDLSKVLFIFSYNNFNNIDPILADRIHRVQFNNLTKNDKIYIIKNYLLPELLDTVGFPNDSVIFPNKVLKFIIYNYTLEGGIRKLKQIIFEIVREINLQYLKNLKKYALPITITEDIVKDIFSNKLKINYKKIADKPSIGLVNGLYATNSGIGGITVIESFKTYSSTKLSLMLTGQQGDVMKESVECAKTIAWNLVPKKYRDAFDSGIHVHCPEAAVPKDGPSAGGAITLALVSLFTNTKVKNTVALTGEIDLNGSIHAIGGLNHKIDGGKLAGVELILYPKQNEQDIEIIKNTNKEILENIEIKPVSTIWEILDYCLEDNDIEFNNYV